MVPPNGFGIAKLIGMFRATVPSSTLAARLVPSLPIIRRRSAAGLKSIVARTPSGNLICSWLFGVTLPSRGLMMTTDPSETTPCWRSAGRTSMPTSRPLTFT